MANQVHRPLYVSAVLVLSTLPSDPLYVIDGFPTGNLINFDSRDIESVEMSERRQCGSYLWLKSNQWCYSHYDQKRQTRQEVTGSP